VEIRRRCLIKKGGNREENRIKMKERGRNDEKTGKVDHISKKKKVVNDRRRIEESWSKQGIKEERWRRGGVLET
jgi:hypothetical protein